MALTTPSSASDVIDRAVLDVFNALIAFNAKPALRNSWLNALIVAFSNRVFDFYFALDQAALEALPDTAVVLLDRWAAIWGITRIASVQASGNVLATGTVGSAIAIGSVLVSGDDQRYTAQAATTITAITGVAITSLTSDGAGTATATVAAHGLASNAVVTVTGAVESEYNVSASAITVVDADTFTYAISGTPSTPATGSPVIAYDAAVVAVAAEEFGDAGNQVLDATLRFESPISGVDEATQVDASALGGGTDQETDAALRERLLERIQNPVAHFNVAEITAVAKTIPGVTRVFVDEITPTVGQVTIYFMRDNDATPLPSGAEVTAVEAVIEAIRPANTDVADVIVLAPSGVTVDFTFTDMQPNTVAMRNAVTANLEQFFQESTEVGANIDADAYRSAIFNTIDPTTGATVTTFVLSGPAGDIAIGAGEIGILGSITYP